MWSSCGRCWWSVSSCHRLQPCVIELLRGYLCPPPKWPLPPPECPPLRLELLPLDTLRDEIKEYIEQDEDVLSYALFGQVATKFFEYRQAQKYKIDPDMVDMEDKVHPMA